ncbi:hypothetical protein AX16_003584 [Volvariella volvacea WC 439]|nr:hypothetical protein AX16_003584 [Volvariella volvacea WC 439]
MNKGGDLAKLLDMMFGESRMDDIRSVVGQSREECSGENLWFISDQADLAIRLGALQLSYVRDRLNQFPDQEAYRIECSTVIDSPRLFTADGVLLSEKQQRQCVTFSTKAGVKPPNQILMDFLKRFTFMSFSVGVEIKRNRGAFRTDWDGLIPTPVSLYRWIFQVIPNSVRLRVYKLLFRAGVYLYGAPGFASGPAQRVPFGLYIKWGPPNRLRNEERALKLIEQETTIPAPRHIGTCEKGDGDLYMLVTRIPGRTLKSTLFTFSTAELKNLRWDLIQVLIRLRRVQNKSGFLISNTLGEGVRYQCFGEAQCGPFYSEQDFDNFMLQKFLEPERRELRSVLSNDIVLTHGDLHGDNIIVLNGRLSGIVDWEMAAWMPSYWEYLRMERLALHEGEEILLRPEKVFKELGEDWTSLVLRQDKIWSSLG